MYRKKNFLSKTTLLIGIILGAGLLFGLQRWSTQLFSLFSTPVLYVHTAATKSINSIRDARKEYKTLKAEFGSLKVAYEKAQEELVEQAALIQTCKATAELSAFSERYKLQHAQIAQVLLKHLTPEQHFFLVNAGRNRGIQSNMIALYHQQIVGKVVEVYPFYSKILLLTDPKSRIAAECTKTGTRGIAEGTGSEKTLQLSFAAHFSDLQDDELVISLGTGLIFPRGFGLGKLIKKQQNGIFHNAEITPIFPVEEIDYCTLIDRIHLESSAKDSTITTTPNTNTKTQNPAPLKTSEKAHLAIPCPPAPVAQPTNKTAGKKPDRPTNSLPQLQATHIDPIAPTENLQQSHCEKELATYTNAESSQMSPHETQDSPNTTKQAGYEKELVD